MTDWRNATRFGSPYEEQFNPETSCWRYRPIQQQREPTLTGYGDWIYGKAPN